MPHCDVGNSAVAEPANIANAKPLDKYLHHVSLANFGATECIYIYIYIRTYIHIYIYIYVDTYIIIIIIYRYLVLYKIILRQFSDSSPRLVRGPLHQPLLRSRRFGHSPGPPRDPTR